MKVVKTVEFLKLHINLKNNNFKRNG